MARKPLNLRQIEVLQWIADDCPNGVMSDSTYKTTAVALSNRRVAKISKRGGWHAEITEDGRHYLEHGAYPGDAEMAPKASATRASRPGAIAARPKPSTPPAVGGHEHQAAASFSAAERGPTAKPRKPDLRPVPVPAQLRNPHPVVLSLQNDKRHFGVTGVARHRALRIVQGLVIAAEREGYNVKPIAFTRSGYGYISWESKDHFTIDTGECKIGVRVLQDKDRSPHIPTAHELAEQKRSGWPRQLPKYDHAPSDRLRIEVGGRWGSSAGRQHSWGDGKRATLEDKLPEVLAEIVRRNAEARDGRIEHERKENEYQRLWRIEVEKAKVLLRESHRAEVLQKQVSEWRRAQEVREYLGALGKAVTCISDLDQRADGLAWLQWASDYSDRIDPLMKHIAAPDDPEPTDEALRPFLPQPPRRDWRWW